MVQHGGAKLWPSELRSAFSYVKRVFLGLYRRLTRVRVFGEKLWRGLRRNAIVVANHVTGVDSIILQIALRRRLFMLAARRWFEGSRFVHFFMTFFCETIPVALKEGGLNFPGIKRILELLRRRQSIGVYPSAHLDRDGSVSEINPGAAYLAVKSGTPIVPVYMKNLTLGPKPGSRPWLNEAWEGLFSVVGNIFNRRIEVYIAEPIYPRVGVDKRKEMHRLNAEIRRAFEELRRKAERTRPKRTRSA